ncbi:MAG: InlB B-repeat-containing protein [Lachnospiraceae bacterium]|jgi:uncharacterized repeat protein (TIGR02543 family)|nr:InlB B-repeat-containing protein [Lachnospiraceae bacterium]
MKRMKRLSAIVIAVLLLLNIFLESSAVAFASSNENTNQETETPADDTSGDILGSDSGLDISVGADGLPALGLLVDTDLPSEHESTLVTAPDISLPSSFDNTSVYPSPGNQGAQGSCVAWAVAYAYKTYQDALDHGWGVSSTSSKFSPSYVYNQINFGVDGGSYITDAFDLMVGQGCVSLASMPYDQYDWLTQPTQAQKTAAYQHRASDWYYKLYPSLDYIKDIIYTKGGTVIGIPVYPDFDNISSSNQIYDNKSGNSRGNHAITLIGWDDSKSAFKFINSWGTGWGLSGYGWITYSFVTDNVIYYMDDYVESTPTGYTVSYDANGGLGAPASQSVSAGSYVTIASAPTTPKSYTLSFNANGGSVSTTSKSVNTTFSYWNTNSSGTGSNYSVGSSYYPTSSITLYAKWTNTTAGTLPTPTRAGFTFAGWYTAASGGTQVTASTTISANQTLYAQWTTTDDYGNTFADAYNWTLSYSSSGPITNSLNGTLEDKSDIDMFKFTAPITGSYTLYVPASDFDNYGRLFNSSGTQIAYNDDYNGTNFRITYELTVGAIYYLAIHSYNYYYAGIYTVNITVPGPTEYTITYDANGGSGAPASQSVSSGNYVALSAAPTTAKAYTLTYNANGGSVSTTSKSVPTTFTYWNTNSSGTGDNYSVGAWYMPTSSITLYAKWTNPQAGTLATPTRSGYTFEGWYTAASGGTQVTASTTISANQTLYAQWTAITDDYGNTFADAYNWTLSYSANGSYTNSKSGIIEVEKDVDMFKFTAPVTGVYTIYTSNKASSLYWLDAYLYDSSGAGLAYQLDVGSGISISMELVAGQLYYLELVGFLGSGSYSINITVTSVTYYTVSYDANGGSGAPASQSVSYGNYVALSSAPTTVKAYTLTYNANGGSVSTTSKSVPTTFTYWNTNSSGTGYNYSVGSYYYPTSSITLYAKWTDPQAGTLTTPTRQGYTFTGWYTAATGGTQVTSTTIISANQTIYAHWSASDDYGNTFTDAYNWTLGSSSVTSITNTKTGIIEVTGDIDMFKFTAPYTGTYQMFISASEFDNVGTLYNSSGSQLAYNDDGNTYPNFKISYTLTAGYVYYLAVKSYGNYYTGTYTVNITVPSPVTYTVSYNANGGSGAPASQSVNQDFYVTIGAAPTTAKAYTLYYNANGGSVSSTYKSVPTTFAYWNTNASGTGLSYSPGSIYYPTSSITFYAKWNNPQAGTLPIPTRAGYAFNGWFTATTGGSQVTATTVLIADTTIYAQWTSTDDYGNTFADAYNWALSSSTTTSYTNTKTGSLEIAGDIDMFKFTAPVTGTYSLFITNGTFDNTGKLYNSQEVQLAYDDDGNTYPNFRISYSLTAGSIYYLAVESYNNNKTGDYSVNITVPAPVVYTVSYDANGGSGAPTSQSVYQGSYVTISAAPTTAKAYTLTYNANGGSVSPTYKSVPTTFAYWNTNSAGTGSNYSVGSTYYPAASITFYAKWNNPAAGTLPTPTRTGYTFNGWYTSATGGTQVSATTVLNADTTIYAQWAANDDYGNTFEDAYNWQLTSGGSSSYNNSRSGSIETAGDVDMFKFTAPVTGTYLLYVSTSDFDNYGRLYNSSGSQLTSNDDGNGNLNFKISYSLSAGSVYYLGVTGYSSAQIGTYTVNITVPAILTYTVSYDANGGSGAPASQSVTAGNSVVLASAPTTAKAYTVNYDANGGSVTPSSKTVAASLAYWNTNAAGTGTNYFSGDTYYPTASITFYAKWNTPAVGTLPTPTRSGYTFDGWYTATTGGTRVYDYTTLSENITIYAHWSSSDDYGNTFSDAYNWLIANASTSAYTNTRTGILETTGDIDMFKFTAPVTGTYYLFVSSGSFDNVGTLYNSVGTQLAYDDDGNTYPNFKITYSLTAGSIYYLEVRAFGNNKTGNYTLNITTPSSLTFYTVTYNANGGEGAPASQSVSAGSYVTLASAPTTPVKYQLTYNANGGSVTPTSKLAYATFASWNTNALGTGSNYSAGQTYYPSSSLTLYAKWNNPTVGTLPVPTRTGYTFDGWYTSASAGVQVNTTDVLSADTTIYAHWTLYDDYGNTLTDAYNWELSYSSTASYTNTKTGTLEVANDVDMFKFTAPVTGTYILFVSASSFDNYGRLYNSSGTQIAYDDDSNGNYYFKITYSLTAGSVYYLGVTSYNSYYSGTYTVNITVPGSATYTVTYNANNGTGAPATQTKQAGVPLTLSETIPTRSGYNFMGWGTSSTATTATYQPGGTYSADASITLYAVWNAQNARALSASEKYWFSNSYSYYNSRYNVSDGDFTKLSNYVRALYGSSSATTIINSLQSLRTSSWGGSCYGMAATAILDKNNQIAMNENFDTNKATIYDVSAPRSNSTVESAINYYMISQLIPYLRSTTYYSGTSAFSTQLQNMVNEAKSGKAIFFCYFFSGGGHAIVIIGYSQNADGSHNLIAYDNRYPTAETIVNINASYTTCTVRGSENVTGFEYLTDMSRFDAIDIDGPNNVLGTGTASGQDVGTQLYITSNGGDVLVQNANGGSLTFNSATGAFSGSLKVNNTYFIVSNTEDGSPAPVTFVLNVDSSDTFSFESEGNSGLDVAVVGNGIYAAAEASAADSVTIDKTAGVNVEGNGSFEAKLSLGVNNDISDVVTLNATANDSAHLQLTNDKVIAGADYSDGGELTLLQGAGKETITLNSTNSDNYIIESVNDNVIVTPEICTVTYNANGGSKAPAATSVQYGTAVTLSTTVPTRSGYSFAGWFTAPSGGTKVTNATIVNGNVTYYAQWMISNCIITFNSNGGSSVASKTYSYNSTLGTLPTTTRTGYTFNGWFTAASGGTKIATTTKVTANVTYYAQWTINTYTVTFNANGGSAVSAKKLNYGATLGTLPTTTRALYTFNGWYTAASGGTKIATTTKVTGNVTYYAQWKAKKAPTITYAAHVQNIGWQSFITVNDGKMAGTSGRSLRMEAFVFRINTGDYSGGLSYQMHVQNVGWQAFRNAPNVSTDKLKVAINPSDQIGGTTGKSLRCEAIVIKLTGDVAKYYDVYYRVHVQNYGWSNWTSNGSPAGSQGKSLRMEAVEVKLLPKGDKSAPKTGTALWK